MPSHSRSCSNPNFFPPHLAKLDHLAIIWQATGILIVHGFMEMRMRTGSFWTSIWWSIKIGPWWPFHIGRGRSTPNIHQRSGDNSTSIPNTATDLGMPPCIHQSIQPTTTMTPLPPIIQPSPAIPLAQSPPVPHGEASTHASEDHSPTMEVPSNESESAGPPWLITPDSLILDYEVKRAVHELVKGHYKEPWTGWGKVPKDVRQRIFTAFKGIYTWEPQHESSVLRHFNHEASEWLKKNLYLAHKLYKAPFPWMAPVVWEGLQRYWESEDFKKISEKNKQNRAEIGSSSTVIYHGGSVSTAVHCLRLAEELGREPTPKECFIRTYGRKDGTLEAGRATEIVEQFEKAIVDKCSQGVDEGSINQDELWDEIAIGSHNRVV